MLIFPLLLTRLEELTGGVARIMVARKDPDNVGNVTFLE